MNYTHTIATIFSKLFEPALLLPISFLLCTTASGLTIHVSFFWMVLLLGPVFLYRFWAKKTKGLDWDMYERRSRIRPFIYLLGYLAFATLMVWIFEPVLLPILTIYTVWTLGFFIITALWTKISGHVGGDTLAVLMILQYVGVQWWPLLCTIPLVAWARVVRKDHTMLQVLIGFVYSVIILLLYALVS